ncbi:MAG: CRTAC1 family protein [Acidobacteria bacterium]|nr:CRTAC1 family protein [Acidobacteriota bacterium]
MRHSLKRVRTSRLAVGVFLALWTLFSVHGRTAQQAGRVPQFSDVTASAGIKFVHINGAETEKQYLFEAKGAGLGFFDFDNDGWLDLFIVQGSTMERFRTGKTPHGSLYRNKRDGTFEDITEKAGLTSSAWGMGVTFGDYDNDGFVDIYLTNLKENILYKNLGNGTFRDVTSQAGVRNSGWGSSAAFGDYDQDGDLDLYVCNYIAYDWKHLPLPGSLPSCFYHGIPVPCGPLGLQGGANALYRNNGDGTFTDVTEKSGTNVNNHYFSLGVVWADFDNDRDLDLYVANDSTPNQLFVNQGDGTFKESGYLSGLATDGDGAFQAGMGVDAADYDNDGLLDVFVTNFANDYNTLYHNRGKLNFEDATTQAGLIQPAWLLVGWGAAFIDLDHDGWKDIVHANGHIYPFLIKGRWSERYYQPASLYMNQKDGTFRDASKLAGRDLQKKGIGRGMAFGDFDNDGDLDFVITNLNSSPQLMRNEGSAPNHWAMFKTKGSRSNRDGIGARITVVAGPLRQIWEIKRTVGIYSASDPRAHFGLGQAKEIDQVRVQWPSGTVQEFSRVPADKHYVIDEKSGLRNEF